MKTLGIYGPQLPERSGVAYFAATMMPELERTFRCVQVSNRYWVSPHKFDFTLYHVGASARHHCVFRAIHERPGITIIHEHNCLSYYYESWPELSEESKQEFLHHVSARLGTTFLTLEEVQRCLDLRADPDRYAADVAIERLYMSRITGAVTHSPYIARMLRRRYPAVPIATLPFMAARLTLLSGRRARQSLGVSDQDFLFGTFGFIGEYKRTDKILAAWNSWRDRPAWVKLLIVGERQQFIDIPQRADVIYLDFVEGERQFQAYLSAVDCAIQLRHPTLGETSAVISTLLANNKRVITSDTPYTVPYVRQRNVLRVRPDQNEIPRLCDCFRKTLLLPYVAARYCEAHSPAAYVRRLVTLIRDEPGNAQHGFMKGSDWSCSRKPNSKPAVTPICQ